MDYNLRNNAFLKISNWKTVYYEAKSLTNLVSTFGNSYQMNIKR